MNNTAIKDRPDGFQKRRFKPAQCHGAFNKFAPYETSALPDVEAPNNRGGGSYEGLTNPNIRYMVSSMARSRNLHALGPSFNPAFFTQQRVNFGLEEPAVGNDVEVP